VHHKRGRPKSSRAGCLMCKPNKHQGNKGRAETVLGHRGFGSIRAATHAREDLKGS